MAQDRKTKKGKGEKEGRKKVQEGRREGGKEARRENGSTPQHTASTPYQDATPATTHLTTTSSLMRPGSYLYIRAPAAGGGGGGGGGGG